MRAELGRASPFSSVVAANGHEISDDFGSRVEREAHGQVLWEGSSTRWSVLRSALELRRNLSRVELQLRGTAKMDL
jgi:hypothetical protein